MKTFKLIRSPVSSAAYNMAFDEQIFEHYLEDGVGVFRVYRWEGPAFTYGFSQNPQNEINLKRCAEEGVQIAKRMTGGGILFHDDEITYSFVCNKDDVGESPGTLVSYRNICKFLISFYESLGLTSRFALEAGGFKDRCAPQQLCSAAHEKYDIIIGTKKIGGNAQKRKRLAIFQHGSIPLRINWDFVRKYLNSLPDNISQYATTLSEQLKIIPDNQILEQKLINAFSTSFNINFIEAKEAFYETCLA